MSASTGSPRISASRFSSSATRSGSCSALAASGARDRAHARSAAWVAGLVLALIFVQMLAGALVAGLDAGMGFNTWPLINGAFVPSGLGEASPWYLNLFENPLTVQFDHRMLGYAVVVAALGQACLACG